jgi:hypothetical protein
MAVSYPFVFSTAPVTQFILARKRESEPEQHTPLKRSRQLHVDGTLDPILYFYFILTDTIVGVQTGELLALDQGNKWIENLYRKWNSHPTWKIEPLFRVGSHILLRLLSLPYAIPFAAGNSQGGIQLLGAPSRGIVRPTISLIIEDIKAKDHFNAVDYITRLPEEGVSMADFMHSMYATLSVRPWSPGTRVYGLLDVPATPDGIGACEINTHPFHTDPSCLIENGWTTTWTPPGAITHPHMDFYGPAQYMVHFHGEKLWLLWPPTHQNLEWYSRHHRQVSSEYLTVQAIQDLEGLHVHYFDGSSEDAFLVSPNYIHAVISISDSAHCGTRVWRMSDFDTAERMMRWGIQWCANSLVTRQETITALESINQDLSWWVSLACTKREHRGIKKRLDSLRAEEARVRERMGRGAL